VTTPSGFEPLLRQALDRAIVDGPRRQSFATNVGALLVDACRIARANGVPPEQLVLTMKHHWASVHEANYVDRRESQETLDRLVTACIETYFRVDGARG
jgi:hypothetical protein